MRSLRPWVYVTLALTLLALALFAPGAWATPNNQGTVPSPTRPGQATATAIVPTLAPPPTAAPTTGPRATATNGPKSKPEATSQPGANPAPPVQQPAPVAAPGTAAPVTSTVASPVPALVSGLGLTLVNNPPLPWPGVTLQFTATLANRGTTTITDIVITQTLSTGLVPGPLPAGSTATWQGQALHATVPALGPGEQFILRFSASVPRTATMGEVLQTVGVATGPGGAQAWLQRLLPLPPSELPRTGRGWGASF
jgi:uncharacterized repeat protein (TIGR01451 family)